MGSFVLSFKVSLSRFQLNAVFRRLRRNGLGLIGGGSDGGAVEPGQCDQMDRSFFNIWPFIRTIICRAQY